MHQLVYVMPSTSGRAATYPKRSDKLKFFYELKALRDKLKAQGEAAPGSQHSLGGPEDDETKKGTDCPVPVTETPKLDETPCSPSTAEHREE